MTRKRTRPRDRITQASCLLITALLIVSAVSAGVGTGMASGEPAGMVSVPDQNITEDIPADASMPLGASQLHDGRVLTDSHAMSLDVILTTPARAGEITGTDTASVAGDMALILRDTEHSAGRRVAIDSGLLQTALGYAPEAIYGTHENGERWTAPAEYNDGYLVFDVPHFSSNTVTFSGEVSINAEGATDGTNFQYEVSDGVSIDNATLSLTGETNTQWDNTTLTKTTGTSTTLNLGGNLEPTGPNGEPQIVVEGTKTVTHRTVHGSVGPGGKTQNLNIPNDVTVKNPRVEIRSFGRQSKDWDIGSPSTISGSRTVTLEQNWKGFSFLRIQSWESYNGKSVTLSTSQDSQTKSTDGGLTRYKQVNGPGGYNNGGSTQLTINPSGDYHLSRLFGKSLKATKMYAEYGWYYNTGTKDVSFDSNTDGIYVEADKGVASYTIKWTEVKKTDSPTVSIGGETYSHTGILSDGQTVSYNTDLQSGSHTLGVSTSGGTVNVSLSALERSKTIDGGVSISSDAGTQTVTYDGALSDGQTVNLGSKIDESLIGGNVTVTSQVKSPSSGPSAELNFDLSHTAQDKVTTTYNATAFSERYDISHTYAEATRNAKVTVPFASERVVGIKRFKYRINDGEWHSVAPADRRLEDTTATAYLSQANGGALPAGATIDVQATGRKIKVHNGNVEVTDPTKPGEPLDTQLKIQSRSAGFAVNVGPTDDGERIHYAYSENYPTQDYVVIDGAGNQRLYLPESQPGDTFRMKHVRTKANVVSGDAKIRVVDPDNKKFEIMPGPGGDGDTVELTYYGTQPGNTYSLQSLTREIILDTQTANSPVTFVDDDSHEMWRILLESGGSGDTGGGGGLIGVASGAASSAGSAVSGLLPAISVPALGGIGGVGSAGFALILAGAVAVLVYGNVFGRIAGVFAALNPFGGTPASGGGADTGNGGIDTSGVTSALSGVVTRAGRVGGTAGVRVLRATTQLLTTSTRIIGRESARLARYLAANPSVALGLGGVGVAVAAYQGLVQLTPQATTAILIGSGGLVTYLVLQRTGTFSWLSFGLIFGAFVILGAGAINPDVLASFGASLQDILPLLVIVGAYVVYRILQTRSQDASTPDTIVRFTGGGNGSDDNNN